MTKKSNTTAIIQLSKEKSEKTRIRVEKTISEMVIKKEKINFNSVSEKANVSKSWLYKKKDIRNRIETLRGVNVNIIFNNYGGITFNSYVKSFITSF